MNKISLRASGLMPLIWSSPRLAGAVSMVIYGLVMATFAPNGLGQSSFPYFAYLADGLLHGQLHLAISPLATRDLILFGDRLYLYWPPFPAVIFLPLVALFGVGVSDAPVTLLSAGANVALVAAILDELDRQGMALLSTAKRAWLTAFFAFGTVQLSLAIYPRVWFTAQLLSFTLLGGAYLVALRGRSARAVLLAGALLGTAVLTRNSTLMAGFGILWLICRNSPVPDWRICVTQGALLLLPVALAVGFLGLYNYARFGSLLDSGLAYHLMADVFVGDFRQYGAFNLHYIAINFYYNFLSFPYLALFGSRPETEFWMGGSLFLMSPMYFLAFAGIARTWRRGGAFVLVSCLMGLTPMMLLMGTGWITFGPRYTFDVAVPLMFATAFGASLAPAKSLAYLAMISTLIYLPGALLLSRAL